MGKNKQAQRTKSNARPSNSSRSAELLGTAMPNFVGFSAVKDGGYVPVLPGLTLCNLNDIEMHNVNSDFQIVLKKMNKKDATTKYKALQEFATMCQTAELSAVEGMLPFWPRLYSVLAIDIEHKVREAAQVAHAAVVKRVGKGIAMYLKQVAGPWFTSQHDTYPPAASAATNSFNETFPQKKIVDVIIHCQHEILSYICDNIITQTPQTLSIHKSLSAEEMETKYQKVLVASLHSYSYYFKKVPFQEVEKTIEIHQKIISNIKFWKLAKHNALPIKTAFFTALTSIIENADALIQNDKKRTVTVIMNSLDETEPALSLAIWESMLVAINKVQDWYIVVSIEKLVLPKLWRILRGGGQCCASVVYPNLLPFLSQFPKLNIDNTTLYTNFFENMRQGFSAKSVQLSRSEMFAVTVSFVECLRYAILLNANDVTLCEKLLKEQLIPIIEMCLTENIIMKQILFCEVIQLLIYWSKNRYNEEYKSYPVLLRTFWTELKQIYEKLINMIQTSNLTSIENISNCQIEFLLNLRDTPNRRRKNLKVNFAEIDQFTEPKCQIQKVEIEVDSVFQAELFNFVNDFCVTCFNKINTHHFIEYIEYLNKIITHFECQELFSALTKSLNPDISFFEFYNETLQNWLTQASNKEKHVVELIFKLVKYMDDTDKDKVLSSLTEFENITISRSIIECGLSKNNRNDAVIKKWCSQSKVTSLLIDVTKEVVSGSYTDLERNKNLILLAFDLSEDGDPLINEDKANQIITILCDSINQKNEASLVELAKLILQLIPLVWTYKKPISGAVELLKALFVLCTQEYSNNYDSISMKDMQNVWKKGLSECRQRLAHSEFTSFTKQIAAITWNEICNTHEADVKDLLVDIATDFLEVIINNEIYINTVDMKVECAKEVLSTFLTESNISTWMAEVTEIVIYAEVITGHLYVSKPQQEIRACHYTAIINLTDNVLTDNTENCFMWALFVTKLLSNFYLRCEQENVDENEIENQIVIPGFTEILINIIHSVTLGHIYVNYYKSTKCYKNVEKLLTSIKNNLKNLQKYITKKEHEEILHYIQKYKSEYGSILPYIINVYFTELCVKGDLTEYCKICKNNGILPGSDACDKEAYLQAVQIVSQYLDPENIQVSTDDLLSALIVGRNILSTQANTSIHVNILERIVTNQQQNSNFLLLDCDISDESWENVALTLEVIRFLTELIIRIPRDLSCENWDFILISLASWQVSVNKSRRTFNDLKVTALTVAVSQLFYEFQSLMHKHEIVPLNELPPAILDEWKAVFANDIHRSILQTWKLHAESCIEKMGILKPIIALDYLGRTINLLYAKELFKNENVSTDSNNLDETIKLCLKLLQSPAPSIQLAAYHCLKHVISELVEQDKTSMETECFHPLVLSIRNFEEALLNIQYIVNTMLIDFKLCDTISCTIQPYTDSYTYTLGYLLLWAIVLDMCANTHGDLRYQYAEILKKDLFPCLLNNIFRLMPVEVLQDNKNKAAKLVEMFSTIPSLNFAESWTEWRLDHIVCWLYTNTLRHLPVLVRQWWSTADSRVSAAVDRITMHYVSPMLCQEELLNNRLVNVENMQVKVHPTAREVVALYQMDDTELELSIVLPPNHPLGPVTVEPGQHAGGTANWRNCHMQLSIFLTHQNGSIWDGLISWKKNLDKKFAGVEECYICFSIFHISTYQIPKLSCHTCRKKFHTPCLYKWFSTSQKSTCPICRNVF
ncbi:hypothetical protein HZH66_005169 [Vespula vulgaris]|uniref:E3 ubiquitin-protein ligase listerin n=1 Tax=Vespula vulgaris TaxID=7454 RepID=A0A834NB76_VESVU|nr:E3 ubiquitin-protein ligase listerin [Vespula vulgaris]KAF7402902.1 hypothetical protein HZH66_005169 [Vespula vulgaris]